MRENVLASGAEIGMDLTVSSHTGSVRYDDIVKILGILCASGRSCDTVMVWSIAHLEVLFRDKLYLDTDQPRPTLHEILKFGDPTNITVITYVEDLNSSRHAAERNALITALDPAFIPTWHAGDDEPSEVYQKRISDQKAKVVARREMIDQYAFDHGIVQYTKPVFGTMRSTIHVDNGTTRFKVNTYELASEHDICVYAVIAAIGELFHNGGVSGYSVTELIRLIPGHESIRLEMDIFGRRVPGYVMYPTPPRWNKLDSNQNQIVANILNICSVDFPADGVHKHNVWTKKRVCQRYSLDGMYSTCPSEIFQVYSKFKLATDVVVGKYGVLFPRDNSRLYRRNAVGPSFTIC
jgi:hypothetical protein